MTKCKKPSVRFSLLRSRTAASINPETVAAMPTDYARASKSDAPPTATNVATAYPPGEMQTSRLPKLVSILAFVGAIAVFIIHSVDHPATNAAKSAFNNAVSSTLGKGSPSISLDELPTTKRLAVCFSGDVGMLASVYEQNLEAIHAFDKSAAVFYHLNLHDDYHHEQTGKHYTKIHDVGDLQPVFDVVKPVAVKTFSASDVAVPPQSNCHRKNAESHEHYSHNYMQFYAAAGCYDMIKAAERAAGEKYGWILQLQPNMKILVKKPADDVTPRVHLSGSAMALIPRQMTDVYFSVVDAFSHGKCTPLDEMGIEPCKNYSYDSDSTECLIIKWLKLSDIIPSNGVYVNRRVIYPEEPEE